MTKPWFIQFTVNKVILNKLWSKRCWSFFFFFFSPVHTIGILDDSILFTQITATEVILNQFSQITYQFDLMWIYCGLRFDRINSSSFGGVAILFFFFPPKCTKRVNFRYTKSYPLYKWPFRKFIRRAITLFFIIYFLHKCIYWLFYY